MMIHIIMNVGTGRDLSPKNTESYKSFNHINQRFR